MSHLIRLALRSERQRLFTIQRRCFVDLNRPRPPPLPSADQQEFEELQRRANSVPSGSPESASHPDAPAPVKPEFEGEVNPATGERGGPKREPVRKWVKEDDGDWSFKGRVSDF